MVSEYMDQFRSFCSAIGGRFDVRGSSGRCELSRAVFEYHDDAGDLEVSLFVGGSDFTFDFYCSPEFSDKGDRKVLDCGNAKLVYRKGGDGGSLRLKASESYVDAYVASVV